MADQNPLKTQKNTENSKRQSNQLKHQKISPKNPRGFPSMVSNSAIVGKPLDG
jgi:hypothetical protein